MTVLKARARIAALAAAHPLFSAALLAGVLVRVVVLAGFAPAILFRLDTYDYLWDAAHLTPNVVNPSGYSVFLWLLEPFHSLVLVVVLQHVMGLCCATVVYALVRRYGLPAWSATLAAAPVLFDPAQLLIEQFVMADLLAMALMLASVAVLLLRTVLTPRRCVAAGLLAGVAVTVRPTTLPLVVLIPAYVALRRAGWRRALAGLLGGLLPVVTYVGWFAAAHGSFNMTNSNGLFLWSRTMTFANCSVIQPPADLVPLCPQVQPGMPAGTAHRPLPKRYLWDHRLWQWQPRVHAPVPDTAAFTPANNERALRFALLAITAQPITYADLVVRESLSPFVHTDNLRFPVVQPVGTLGRGNRSYALGAVIAYTGTTQGLTHHLSFTLGTQMVQPFARLVGVYQRVVFLPGPVFGLVVAAGFAGLLLPRRRTLDGGLLWVAAMAMMVLPTAEHEYTYRYVVPAVPLVCIAAALALRRRAAAPPVAASESAPARVPASG